MGALGNRRGARVGGRGSPRADAAPAGASGDRGGEPAGVGPGAVVPPDLARRPIPPPLRRLALEAAVAAATARVAAGMFRNPYKGSTVYGVSALYVLFAALDAVALPVPLLRLVLAALAAVGALALAVAERRAARSPWAERRLFLWLLRLGTVALATVLAAEALGYHFLAQRLLEAAVATAFVIFVVTFLVRLARGAFRFALSSREVAARFRFLRRVGAVLADRLALLVKLVLVGWAAFYIASIWGLASSPASTWRSFVEAGVEVGERDLTVGRLLLAVAAVYLAFVASWVLCALLDQTLIERRRLGRRIRDSTATLLYYAVIMVGVFVALTFFGLDLTSKALIAEALGVGIGFGLQNVVNNFVSRLILLFERTVQVGRRHGPGRGVGDGREGRAALDFEQLLEAPSALAAAITRRFDEEGIQSPFPQRELHFRSIAPKPE